MIALTDGVSPHAHLRNLWHIAHRLFKNEIGIERSYRLRRYQVRAAVRAVAIALNGQNAGIELPTGTGKTVIACLAAVFWKRFRPESKILLIVPSRTLVVQHFEVALWIAREIIIDRLTDEQSGDPGAIRQTLIRSDLVISTPGILANGLKRGVIDTETANTIELVIVDEFDQFIVIEEGESKSVARFADNWGRLAAQLPQDVRYVVKSATLGLGVEKKSQKLPRSKAARRSKLIDDLLSPKTIVIPERSYASVIPLISVNALHQADHMIDSLLNAVAITKGMAHLQLDHAIGVIDYSDVERRAPQLCAGPLGGTVQIRTAGSQYRKLIVYKSVRDGFCRITKLLMMPQHILEDLTKGLGVELREYVRIKTRSNEECFLENQPVLVDKRDDAKFRFQRGLKTDTLLGIVTRRSKAKERGVIFCRTITLLEGIRPVIAKASIPIFELTGEKLDHERKQAVQAFRDSENGILLMTRTTGGRGLDLPFAQYAVFYSPKTDPVAMWQEMSRIRSTVSNPKDVFILCYGQEMETISEVVTSLKTSGRRMNLLEVADNNIAPHNLLPITNDAH